MSPPNASIFSPTPKVNAMYPESDFAHPSGDRASTALQQRAGWAQNEALPSPSLTEELERRLSVAYKRLHSLGDELSRLEGVLGADPLRQQANASAQSEPGNRAEHLLGISSAVLSLIEGLESRAASLASRL